MGKFQKQELDSARLGQNMPHIKGKGFFVIAIIYFYKDLTHNFKPSAESQ